MHPAQQALASGIAAFKRGQPAEAERLLTAAYHAYPERDQGRWTACIHLGMICQKQERWDEAIQYLEKGLPYPGAFAELVKLYRKFGKQAGRSGDIGTGTEWFRRLYCLAKLQYTVMTIRAPSAPVAVDWVRASSWIEDVRTQCGSIYAYQFDGAEIEGDTLLTAADYKALRGER